MTGSPNIYLYPLRSAGYPVPCAFCKGRVRIRLPLRCSISVNSTFDPAAKSHHQHWRRIAEGANLIRGGARANSAFVAKVRMTTSALTAFFSPQKLTLICAIHPWGEDNTNPDAGCISSRPAAVEEFNECGCTIPAR
jgi:hypothetical protein